MKTNPATSCQIKICGLTDPDEAAACADAGAHAIGLVFYPKSRRCVSPGMAARIRRALPPSIPTIGVFVNESAATILDVAARGELSGVQLHGQEPPELVRQLKKQGLPLVVKALYLKSEPSIAMAGSYGADACLVECAGGVLPGGNAMTWDWREAAGFGNSHPFILAGGLDPQNVAAAIESARPDAVDVSSGVEASPGKKDLNKIKEFINAVTHRPSHCPIRRIFNVHEKNARK